MNRNKKVNRNLSEQYNTIVIIKSKVATYVFLQIN